MIKFERVNKIHDIGRGATFHAVKDLSFTVESGECCCLLGPNGAGKTTSINMMLGFMPVSSGTIDICGTSVNRDPHGARRHISYIPDEVALYVNLTGIQNLRFFDELLGQKNPLSRYEELCARVGLTSAAAHKKLKSYSKGMRQRLAIAVSLLKNASVYVFDEPTTGLDPRGVRELMDIINWLKGQGKTLLITTHDLLHISAFATTVLFLAKGQLIKRLEHTEFKSMNLEDTYLELCEQPDR